MIFKDAIMKVDNEKVIEIIKVEYPNQIELLQDYNELLNELKDMKPEDDGSNITVAVDWAKPEPELDEEGYYIVHGYEPEKNVFWGLGFTPYKHWLSYKADQRFIMMNGIDEYIAHCLWEMTFYGFQEEEKEELIQELIKRKEEVEAGLVKTIPWEEVKKQLLEEIDN